MGNPGQEKPCWRYWSLKTRTCMDSLDVHMHSVLSVFIVRQMRILSCFTSHCNVSNCFNQVPGHTFIIMNHYHCYYSKLVKTLDVNEDRLPPTISVFSDENSWKCLHEQFKGSFFSSLHHIDFTLTTRRLHHLLACLFWWVAFSRFYFSFYVSIWWLQVEVWLGIFWLFSVTSIQEKLKCFGQTLCRSILQDPVDLLVSPQGFCIFGMAPGLLHPIVFFPAKWENRPHKRLDHTRSWRSNFVGIAFQGRLRERSWNRHGSRWVSVKSGVVKECMQNTFRNNEKKNWSILSAESWTQFDPQWNCSI